MRNHSKLDVLYMPLSEWVFLQCWEKATNYLDVEERFVHLTDEDYVATPEGVRKLVDENTIGKNPQLRNALSPGYKSSFAKLGSKISSLRNKPLILACFTVADLALYDIISVL